MFSRARVDEGDVADGGRGVGAGGGGGGGGSAVPPSLSHNQQDGGRTLPPAVRSVSCAFLFLPLLYVCFCFFPFPLILSPARTVGSLLLRQRRRNHLKKKKVSRNSLAVPGATVVSRDLVPHFSSPSGLSAYLNIQSGLSMAAVTSWRFMVTCNITQNKY